MLLTLRRTTMANDNVVEAASRNLHQSIGGLVQVSVILARVLQNAGVQQFPRPNSDGRDETIATDDFLRNAMAALEIGGYQEERAQPLPAAGGTSTEQRAHGLDRRAHDRVAGERAGRPTTPAPNPPRTNPVQPPQSERKSPTTVMKKNAPVPTRRERHYAVFEGKEVGVTDKWYVFLLMCHESG